MAKHKSKDSDVELELPEADYGAEIRGMNAVLTQMRNLIGNLEGLLFSLMVHSHKPPPKPEKMVVMEEGDIVEKEVPRLIRGSITGICSIKGHPDVGEPEREEDVRTATDEQAATTPSSK